MSGGWAVKAKKRGVVRAGACHSLASDRRLHGPRFLPEGLGLDGQGAAGPDFENSSQPKAVTEQNNGRMGGSEAETIRQPRDRLKGQPQERQHSAAEGGTRDRPPPARGSCAFDAYCARLLF